MIFNTGNIERLLVFTCLIISLCFGAFLFSETNKVLKYSLFFLGFLTVFLRFINGRYDSMSLAYYSDFFKPWIPWLCSIVILIGVHGLSGHSNYLGSCFLMSILLMALYAYPLKRDYVIVSMALTTLLITASVSFSVIYSGVLKAEIFGVNKNLLLGGTTLLTICCLSQLFFYWTKSSKWFLALLVISIISSLTAIVITEVRTALLAFLALIPLFLTKCRSWKTVGLMIFVCLILFGLFLYSGRLQEGINDIIKYQGGNSNSSWGIRLELWKLSTNAFMVKPLFGWGVQPFYELVNNGFKFPVMSFYVRHFHSDFFNMLVTGGITGILGWLITIYLLFKKSWNDEIQLSLLTGILAIGLADRYWFENRAAIYLFAVCWVLLYLSRVKSVSTKL